MPLAVITHNVSDIATAVKRQFGDESGTQIGITDIIRWINQGQSEITRKGEVNRATATTPSVAGQNQYNFAGSNIIKLLAIFYNDIPLENITFEQAQESILRSLPNSLVTPIVIPTHWYEWADSIYIYPTPISSNDTIKIYAIVAPALIVSSSDPLSIPDTHYQALLQYVLQQAYELDDNFSNAGIKAQQMEASLSSLSGTSSYKHYPVITVLEEDQ